jgi:hypothetical protein
MLSITANPNLQIVTALATVFGHNDCDSAIPLVSTDVSVQADCRDIHRPCSASHVAAIKSSLFDVYDSPQGPKGLCAGSSEAGVPVGLDHCQG